MIYIMSDVSSPGIFEGSGESSAEVSVCQIKSYLVISLSISPLGFIGTTYNQGQLRLCYETQLLWFIIEGGL